MIYEAPKIHEVGDAQAVVQGVLGSSKDADQLYTLASGLIDLDD